MTAEMNKSKQLILEKAGELFLQDGYHEVSIRDIAKACEMTNAALYYYFDDKEALFFEVVDYFINGLIDKFEEISLLALPPKEKITKMLVVFLEFSVNSGSSFTRIMHDVRHLTKEKLHQDKRFIFSPSGRNMMEPLDNCFAEAELIGEIRDLEEPFRHSSLLMSLNRGVVTTLVHECDHKIEDTFDLEKIANLVINLYWHGVEID